MGLTGITISSLSSFAADAADESYVVVVGGCDGNNAEDEDDDDGLDVGRSIFDTIVGVVVVVAVYVHEDDDGALPISIDKQSYRIGGR